MIDKKLADDITEVGANALGGSVGALAGTAIAGPPGAVAGAIIGSVVEKVFSKVGKDINDRVLSPNEDQRVESVLKLASDEIEKKLNKGETFRNDDFFSEGDCRSTAEELLEGTLLAAQREYEERKLPYLGKLYANIAFDKTISRPMANQLIKMATDLSYRQLVILSSIGLFQLNPNAPIKRKDMLGHIEGYDKISIATDIYELYHRGLVHSSSVIMDVAGINPSLLELQGNGALLFNLMELANMEMNFEFPDVYNFLVDTTGK